MRFAERRPALPASPSSRRRRGAAARTAFASRASVSSPTAVFERSRLVRLPSDSRYGAAVSSMPFTFHRLKRRRSRRFASAFSPFDVIAEPLKSRCCSFSSFESLREPEIGDAHPAGDPAFGFAVRRPEILRPRRSQRDAGADVQILESAEQRDRLELQVGDHRRPAPPGIAALDAVETELPEPGQQLQHVQARAADLVAAEIQLFELRERREVLEADVGDLRKADVERLQLRQLRDILRGSCR